MFKAGDLLGDAGTTGASCGAILFHTVLIIPYCMHVVTELGAGTQMERHIEPINLKYIQHAVIELTGSGREEGRKTERDRDNERETGVMETDR